MVELPLPYEVARHAHLQLQRQQPTGLRRPARARGARNGPNYPDQPAHGRQLTAQFLALRAVHARRTSVLGVDPELVVVLELHRASDALASYLRNANLEVLDWFDDRVVVTAANDPELQAFRERLDAYAAGPATPAGPSPSDTSDGDAASPNSGTGREPDDESDSPASTAAYQALFDEIRSLRAFGPTEAITPALAESLSTAAPGEPLLVDVQCWCPENEQEARARLDAVRQVIEQAPDGSVLDSTLRHRAGLSLLRAELSPDLARSVAGISHVRRLDVLPRPSLGRAEVHGVEERQLPIVTPPDASAPTIAVIDSGIRGGHPLLAGAVVDQLAVAGLDAEHDGDGHGTFVASLALHGSLEPLLYAGQPLRGAAKLVSIRVLDDDNFFPNTTLWEKDLLDALDLAADAGARVINLSLGDARRPYRPSRPTPLAAQLDAFARERNIVLVISAGNYPHTLYPADPDIVTGYAAHLLEDDAGAGLLDPATSALALTVGALCADDGQGQRPARQYVDHVPAGGMDLPSPVTRRGPGAADMVKPEIVMPGGSLAIDAATGRMTPGSAHEVVGAEGKRHDRLLSTRLGTSMAAPLVTHAAARVLAEDLGRTANGVRALVLSSVRPLSRLYDEDSDATRRATRLLTGFGRADAERAATSTDHRAVLISENSLPVNSVHLYKVPIPSSFRAPGGKRSITLALAYDPPTRSTRLDYLASRMHTYAYKGVDLATVASAFLAYAPNDDEADAPAGPAGLANKALKPFMPSDSDRGRGAHHVAQWPRTRPVTDDGDFIFVVQNINNWDEPDAEQAYALALVLEHEDGPALYAELRAEVEAQLEATVMLEVEL
ncbi:MAG: hypothetical protein JWO62_2534 [Acidimicrobiaceae bacterium]|nr:hypothetical protein [Acidimicrobiaceae bacterium]